MGRKINTHKFGGILGDAATAVGGVRELSRRLDVSIRTIYFWVSGQRKIPVQTRVQIEQIAGSPSTQEGHSDCD